ncbi:hypothetical protein [Paenibacillus sp. FSL R7-0026]|uniref:hypothetical protein n=1 Tax=Paenibacillus sp. FSL R7-0026 TaxID=2921668 RepID=UPI0030F5BEB4
MSNTLNITLSIVGAYIAVGVFISFVDYILYRLKTKNQSSQSHQDFPWLFRAIGYTIATLIWPAFFFRTTKEVITHIKNRKALENK